MAVDKLPCELPGNMYQPWRDVFVDHVIPAVFNCDKDSVIEWARMTTSNEELTPGFSYLQEYVDGNE